MLERTQLLPAGPEEVFAFFADPRNLESITPRWLRFRIVRAPERLQRGSLIDYRLRLFGWPLRWRAEIVEWQPPRSFRDVQRLGPYALWEHTHRFAPADGATEVYDHIRYRLPAGPLAPLARRLFVRGWLDDIFDYRARRLAKIFSGGGDFSSETHSG